MFQHYILTRFNLRAEDWTTTKNNEKVLTEEWLEERFDLFENYCFSSVRNQTNQNFKWLVVEFHKVVDVS
ncbi:glycosyltransferase [Gillisia sp. JM1]|uniref:glycosyltransferase n=1 Tax=Gillisia sp. JM1 TaxID=1283286 RepID=UPI000428D286|nr:glycosyltransferase [Gillisia sp. JM1]